MGASISESKKRKRTDLDGNAAASLDVLEALHGQSVDTDASSDSVSVSLSGFLHPMLARRILATLSYVYLGCLRPVTFFLADLGSPAEPRLVCR